MQPLAMETGDKACAVVESRILENSDGKCLVMWLFSEGAASAEVLSVDHSTQVAREAFQLL